MAINIEKQNSSKFLNIKNGHNINNPFKISHSDNDYFNQDQDQHQNEPQDNIGLDFLTNEIDNDPEEEEAEEESEHDPMMDQPYGNDNEFERNEPDLSYEEIQQRKAFALYNLNRYKKKGYQLSRNFGTGHSLDELETEVLRIENEKSLDNGLDNMKDAIFMFTKAVETANGVYGHNYIKLNGWSMFFLEEYKTGKYDDCFIKLWKKYSSKLPDMPELTLIWLLGASMITFHMSRILAEDMMKKKSSNYQAEIPQMKQPSTSYEDLMNELDDSDTNSIVSEMSLGSNMSNVSKNEISISIPETKTNTPKKRGRPAGKKNKVI